MILVSYDPKGVRRLRAFTEGQGEHLRCVTRSRLGLAIVIGVKDFCNLVIDAIITFIRFDVGTKFLLLLYL